MTPERPSGLELSVPRLEPDEAFVAQLAATAGSATLRRARRGHAAMLLTAFVAAVAATFSGTALLVPVGDHGPVGPLAPAASHSSSPVRHPHRPAAVATEDQADLGPSMPLRHHRTEQGRGHPGPQVPGPQGQGDRPAPPPARPSAGGPHHAAGGPGDQGDEGDQAPGVGSDDQGNDQGSTKPGDGAGDPQSDDRGGDAQGDDGGQDPSARKSPAEHGVRVPVQGPGRVVGGKDVGED
jgi:hypothetical protein